MSIILLMSSLSFVLGSVLGGLTENCLTWAARQTIFHGGELLTRPSTFANDALPKEYRGGWVYWVTRRAPHFLWRSPSGTIYQYTVSPDGRQADRDGSKNLILVWLRLWFYKGHVVEGDEHGDTYKVLYKWQ